VDTNMTRDPDTELDEFDQKPGHWCGVAAVFSKTPINIPAKLYYTLFSLQHRGQESAGIAWRKNGQTVCYKDLGMVSQVLGRYLEGDRQSTVGIGHVRYSTHGGNKLENAQPLVVKCNKGEIAIAHNGNLTNTEELKHKLFMDGSIFQSSSDTELFLHLISRSLQSNFRDALVETLGKVQGAFSLTILHEDALYAVRDPWGFRPLYIGFKDDMTVVASETCALDILNITEYRSMLPGEVVRIDQDGLQSFILPRPETHQQCIFELIYFARPDSKVFDYSVHVQRKLMGRALAESDAALHVDAIPGNDVVVPVPDSGTSSAIGYAEASGIPFDMGLTRNHYTGRSFIMPTKGEREMVVKMKLHPVREAVQGKRVFLVDDSLVRGTTARLLVKLLRDAGAREVHLRLTAPEIRWPCFFGIDIPTRSELISNTYNPGQVAEFVGADSVRFLATAQLRSTVRDPHNFCMSCFTGEYCMAVPIKKSEMTAKRDQEGEDAHA
jgi:amidophosphoribosyltransferase